MLAANAEGSSISFVQLGTIGGDQLTIGEYVSISIEDMKTAHESWFPEFMEGKPEELQAAE